MDKTYQRAVRMGKLHEALIAAGITPTLVEGDAGGVTGDESILGTYVHIVAPQAEGAVDAVVNAHDATIPGASEQRQGADADALAAFRLGWVLGQARLGRVAANGIQRQMDTIEAANINSVSVAQTHIKTLAEAVEDIAGQLQTLKRTVAIQAQVPDR